MTDFPSRSVFFEIGAQVIREKARRIDPAQIYVEGSDVNILLAAMSAMNEETIRQLALAEGRGLLDVAEGDALERWGWDRYQIAIKGAAAALGTVEFARVSAAAGGGTIAEGTLVKTDTGIQYRTLADVTFGASDVGPIAVDVIAVEAGKESQVGEGRINAFVSPPFDSIITVTNPEATAGGEPRESEALYRERIRGAFRAARRGIAAAIEQGALAVLGVVSAKAVEVTNLDGSPARFVELFIADSNGLASTALAAKVDLSLREYRACGIYVRVNTSRPVFVDIALRFRFQAGVDTLTLTSRARNAILAYVNGLGTQATLYVNALQAVLERFAPSGLIAEDDAIAEPVGDLVPASGETIRTTLDRITVE